jgi:hypothetical protein
MNLPSDKFAAANAVPSAGESPLVSLEAPSMSAALAAGILSALIAALSWAAITLFSGYQIGWMAIGVGIFAGLAVRHFGNGAERSYGAMGALLAILGCVLGNVIGTLGFLARQDGLSAPQILDQFDMQMLADIWLASFRPMDLLFYLLAAYEGYTLSLRRTR